MATRTLATARQTSRRKSGGGFRRLAAWVGAIALICLNCLVLAVPAGAANKGLTSSCGEEGSTGGKFATSSPGGIAVNPTTGNIYVADKGSNRIQEFTPNCSFIRAWGWDVLSNSAGISGQANAKQLVYVAAEGGTFTLTFNGQTTSAINFNAPASESQGAGSVEAALKALTTIGAGNVEVSGGPGNTSGATPYAVTFVGALKEANQSTMTVNSSLLTGTTPGANVKAVNKGGEGFEICEVASNCKAAGTPSGEFTGAGGSMTLPNGIAIDPTTGSVYVSEVNGARIDKFTANGEFLRAWGYNVVSSGPDNKAVGVSAVQKVTIPGTVTGGTFALTFDGQTTGAVGNGDISTSSKTITNVNTTSGVFVAGEKLSGVGLPSDAVISTVTSNSITFTASTNPSVAGTQVSLAAALPYNASNTVVQNVLRALPTMAGAGVSVSLSAGVYTLTFRTSLANTPVPAVVANSSGLVGGSATVDPTSTVGVSDFEVCNPVVDVCAAGSSAQAGGNGVFGTPVEIAGKLAVDPSTGNILVADKNNSRMQVFSSSGNFIEAFGWGVNASAPEEKVQACPSTAICLLGIAGSAVGQFGSSSPSAVAVDSLGNVYVVDFANARVEKFVPSGPPAAPTAYTASNLALPASSTPFGVAIDLATNNVLIGIRATGGTSKMEVAEYSSAGTLLEVHGANNHVGEGQANSDTTGGSLGVGCSAATGGTPCASSSSTTGNLYIAVPQSTAPKKIFTLNVAPMPEATILAASSVGATSATLNGVVTPPEPGPEGGFDTTYQFEYSSDGGFSWTSQPVSPADAGSTHAMVPVSVMAAGLLPNTIYKVRLVANDGTIATSGMTEFKTLTAPPSVQYVLGASSLTNAVNPYGPTTVKLAGYINPNNSPTSYRFDYGTTNSYGQQSPVESELFIGSGSQKLAVKATLYNLQPNTTYHYRIVATSTAGETVGADQQFTTSAEPPALDSCGLADNRCFELVSSADQGPVGEGGNFVGTGSDLQMQAAPSGSSVAYQEAYGYPETTSDAGEVLYLAERGSSGWASLQLSSSSTGVNQANSGFGSNGYNLYLSKDLNCGFLSSVSELTPDTPTETMERGGINLFRWSSKGGYTLITKRVPVNLESPEVEENLNSTTISVIGASQDCSRVVFASRYEYAGIPYTGGGATHEPGLYEWNNGTMHSIGFVPSSSGPVISAPVYPGGQRAYHGAIPESGELNIFTAASKVGGDSGREAVFAEKIGQTAVDISQSQGSKPNNGNSVFQTATEDGAYIFFIARYGLAPNSISSGLPEACNSGSGAGCDLYRYSTQNGTLTDLSVDTNQLDTAGASVIGVLDASEDGSYIYFAARGQLVPDQGNTFAQNSSGSGAYNIYLAHGGALSFVASVPAGNVTEGESGPGLLVSPPSVGANKTWSSRTTANGKYLIFQSTGNVTGYNSGGALEVYRYSAEANSTVCVSCRTDGQPSVASQSLSLHPLPGRKGGSFNYNHPRTTISADGSRIFFRSQDVLAPGAISGQINLYEWEHGQVTFIAGRAPREAGRNAEVEILGMSTDGDTLFFSTPQSLLPADSDERMSVYAARVGGGFPSTSAPIVPCEPLKEDSCQGTASVPPSAANAASASIGGPGNIKSQSRRKKHAKHRKKHAKHPQKKGHPKKKGKGVVRDAGAHREKGMR